jgi:hypothetical protein
MRLYEPENLIKLSLEKLENLRQNFEERNATSRADYPLILETIAKKKHPLRDYDNDLTVDAVVRVIEDAARLRKTITYKEITDQLDCRPFNKYRWPLRNILDAIFHDCALKREPIITAIVITQDGLTSDVANGFADAAKRAGMTVPKPENFFNEHQHLVFDKFAGPSSS